MFNSRELRLFLIISVSLIICSDSNVNEYHANYSCCEPPLILLKDQCKHTVSIKDEMIANINGAHKDCIPPCQKNGDKLEVHDCVDFKAENVCKNGKFTVDEVIHYKAQPCQQPRSNQTPPQHQGHVGLLLVALLITGFFFC